MLKYKYDVRVFWYVIIMIFFRKYVCILNLKFLGRIYMSLDKFLLVVIWIKFCYFNIVVIIKIKVIKIKIF